eukprot:CAMPEP_0115039390 /NCGR_PEP_ID=MMETSP0216-20121206/44001_1 /TAXON_ID=223996 /ORGANISM="Protocruzia adherens, Strain Boccale" /LENGTH=1065 /DNA_ID=CAMNT_0002420023 /DNA_START=12 /DNA_END=3209 /DNA_ORIENTATION=+
MARIKRSKRRELKWEVVVEKAKIPSHSSLVKTSKFSSDKAWSSGINLLPKLTTNLTKMILEYLDIIDIWNSLLFVRPFHSILLNHKSWTQFSMVQKGECSFIHENFIVEHYSRVELFQINLTLIQRELSIPWHHFDASRLKHLRLEDSQLSGGQSRDIFFGLFHPLSEFKNLETFIYRGRLYLSDFSWKEMDDEFFTSKCFPHLRHVEIVGIDGYHPDDGDFWNDILKLFSGCKDQLETLIVDLEEESAFPTAAIDIMNKNASTLKVLKLHPLVAGVKLPDLINLKVLGLSSSNFVDLKIPAMESLETFRFIPDTQSEAGQFYGEYRERENDASEGRWIEAFELLEQFPSVTSISAVVAIDSAENLEESISRLYKSREKWRHFDIIPVKGVLGDFFETIQNHEVPSLKSLLGVNHESKYNLILRNSNSLSHWNEKRLCFPVEVLPQLDTLFTRMGITEAAKVKVEEERGELPPAVLREVLQRFPKIDCLSIPIKDSQSDLENLEDGSLCLRKLRLRESGDAGASFLIIKPQLQLVRLEELYIEGLDFDSQFTIADLLADLSLSRLSLDCIGLHPNKVGELLDIVRLHPLQSFRFVCWSWDGQMSETAMTETVESLSSFLKESHIRKNLEDLVFTTHNWPLLFLETLQLMVNLFRGHNFATLKRFNGVPTWQLLTSSFNNYEFRTRDRKKLTETQTRLILKNKLTQNSFGVSYIKEADNFVVDCFKKDSSTLQYLKKFEIKLDDFDQKALVFTRQCSLDTLRVVNEEWRSITVTNNILTVLRDQSLLREVNFNYSSYFDRSQIRSECTDDEEESEEYDDEENSEHLISPLTYISDSVLSALKKLKNLEILKFRGKSIGSDEEASHLIDIINEIPNIKLIEWKSISKSISPAKILAIFASAEQKGITLPYFKKFLDSTDKKELKCCVSNYQRWTKAMCELEHRSHSLESVTLTRCALILDKEASVVLGKTVSKMLKIKKLTLKGVELLPGYGNDFCENVIRNLPSSTEQVEITFLRKDFEVCRQFANEMQKLLEEMGIGFKEEEKNGHGASDDEGEEEEDSSYSDES